MQSNLKLNDKTPLNQLENNFIEIKLISLL